MSEPCIQHGKISSIDERVRSNRNDINKHDDILEKVRNRPPVWATAAMSGAAFIIGILVTLLVQSSDRIPDIGAVITEFWRFI